MRGKLIGMKLGVDTDGGNGGERVGRSERKNVVGE